MNKRLSKYIASFDYFDKSLIVSSVTTGSISITMYKTRNTGTKKGIQGMHGIEGVLYSGECYIPWNVLKHSGKCRQNLPDLSLK